MPDSRPRNTPGCTVGAQQGDGGLGSGFVFHHDVLQRTAQCGLDGNLAPGLHLQDGGYRPQNTPQTAGSGGAHDRAHRVLVAVHVLFQLPQHRKALPGGIQFPAQPLLGGIGFVQRGLAAAQLEFQTGADVAQLLFVFLQRLPVFYGIGQILSCFLQLCGGIPGALFQRGQTLPGGVSGGFGGMKMRLEVLNIKGKRYNVVPEVSSCFAADEQAAKSRLQFVQRGTNAVKD